MMNIEECKLRFDFLNILPSKTLHLYKETHGGGKIFGMQQRKKPNQEIMVTEWPKATKALESHKVYFDERLESFGRTQEENELGCLTKPLGEEI